MSKLALLVIVAFFWTACWAFSTGPPDSVCTSMTPGHGPADTTNLGSSYTVTTSRNQYSPGDKVTVTISGNGAIKLKGFMIQLRPVGGTSAVGSITTTAANERSACSRAAATHNSNTDKASVSVDWTAPSSSVGNVQVWATIVQTQPVWTIIKGPIINAGTSTSLSTTATTTTTTTTTTPTTTMLPGLPACGSTKSCFKSNLECTTNCDFLLTWETAGSEIKFEMSGVTNGYIAVGFSNDQNMGDDNVIMCTNRGEVSNRYQPCPVEPEPIDERNPHFGLTSFSVAPSAQGRINCSFSRKKTFQPSLQNPVGIDVNVTHMFDLKNSYYLLLARGNLDASGEPEMHIQRPSISVKNIDFSRSLLVIDGYPSFYVGAGYTWWNGTSHSKLV